MAALDGPEWRRTVIVDIEREHTLHASMNMCSGCDWRPQVDEGSLAHQFAAHRADRIAAVVEGWLAKGGAPEPVEPVDLPPGPYTQHLARMQEIIAAVADLTSGGRSGMEAFLLAHGHHVREIARHTAQKVRR